MGQSNWESLPGFLQSVWQCPTWHLHLQIGETWIWWWTIQWMKNWLDGSTQRVVVNGLLSTWETVTRGVPWGRYWGWYYSSSFRWHGQWKQVHPQQICWQQQAVWCSGHAGGKGCHPEEHIQAREVGLCKPWEVQQKEVQCPTSGSWKFQTHLQVGQRSDWEHPAEKDLLMKNSTWAGNVRSRPRRPTVPCTASKAPWPAGWRTGFSSYTLFLWDPTWSAESSFGVPNIRRTWNCWSKLRWGSQSW